jgi:GAF domain-containing protein
LPRIDFLVHNAGALALALALARALARTLALALALKHEPSLKHEP